MSYAPDKPLHPELQALGREADERTRETDPSHALARVHNLELLVGGALWLLDKLIKERDAALPHDPGEGRC